jgi:ABC-type oligopeptide transport system ATPase subunit
MKENKVILKLENVSKIYKVGAVPTYALNDVSLDVYKGEILVILRSFRFW